MKKSVSIPEGVKINVNEMRVTVSGNGNELERDFHDQMFFGKMRIAQEENMIVVSSLIEKRRVKAFVGSVAAHIKNMVKGVGSEYVYKMKIVYVHFPMTVKVGNGQVLITNFLGEKKPRKAAIMDDVKVEVKKDEVIITSHNKESAGQTAANIEGATRITRRDRRVYQDGVYIVEKGKL
jgi:large subunit ribosomal protein L6